MELIDILRKQAQVFKDILANKLAKAKTAAEVYGHHSTVFKEFYTHAFKPMTDGESIKDLDSEKMNELMMKMATDINISHGQLDNISRRISESYNANQDYKTSLRNRTEYLASIASDVNIMLNDNDANSIVFKDSLSNYDFVDKTFGGGTIANIATAEGIAFLSIADDKNVSETAKAIKVSGNGEAGNYHVIKKVNIKTFNEEYDIYSKFKSDEDAHNEYAHIIDKQASTWFEYQKLGMEQADAARYGISWANANKISDELMLRINIELEQAEQINWIDITPYMPEQSKSNVSLYSVRTSQDGSEYNSIFKSAEILDQEINIMPQRYSSDDLFKMDTLSKFVSQGVLSFPTTRAKHVEIVLKQTKPYNESIGHIYYEKIVMSGDEEISRTLIGEQDVPPAIIASPLGKYKVDSTNFIVKNIVVFDGWRYTIGVRGIDIYNRKFAPQSEIITKKFEAKKPIRKVMLYANEIIPDEFISTGLDKRNDWIKYYISINDSDWYPISPMHHNQVGDLKIPPKIYEINSISSLEERILSVNKGYLNSTQDITSVRLKMIFSRPETMNTSTPILEEYALRCVVEGGND